MITNNTRTKCKSRPDLDPNRSLESLNPRASADIHVNDPRFLKSMMDSNSYPGDSASSNASSYSSSSTASGGGGGAFGRRSDMSVTSLQEVDESFEPGPFSKSSATTQLTQVAVPVETSSALHDPLVVPSSPSSSPSSAAFRLMAAIPLLHSSSSSSSSSSSPSQNDELIRVIMCVYVCIDVVLVYVYLSVVFVYY
jgi:hypothetical protein